MEHTLHGGGTFVCPINCGPCNQCVGNMSKGEEVEQQLTESVQAINPNMTRPLPIYIQGCCVLVVRGLEQLFRHLSRPIKMIYWLFQWFWNLYKWWLTDWRTIRPSLTGQQRERETFLLLYLLTTPTAATSAAGWLEQSKIHVWHLGASRGGAKGS